MEEARRLPSELTPEEQQMRAAQYRLLAATARTADTQSALLRFAQQYEALAAEQTAKLKDALGLQ